MATSLAPPDPAAPALRWQTGVEGQQVVLGGGHRMAIAPSSVLLRLSSEPHSPVLRVQRGRATFSVRPLGQGRSFRVNTPHLAVKVIGTEFTVEVDEHCTRVVVEHGVVRVTPTGQPAVRLAGPGASGTHCAAPPRAEQLSAAEAQLRDALSLERTAPRRALALLMHYLEQNPNASLAEEALFHAVLLQRRLGRLDRARALTRQFLTRFGDSDRAARLHHQ